MSFSTFLRLLGRVLFSCLLMVFSLKRTLLSNRIWTSDLRISVMITNYSPPLYQLSYREMVEKWMFRWLVCSDSAKCPNKQDIEILSFLKKISQKRLKTLYIYSKRFFAADPVAQWIARRTSNPEAVGSSPTGVVTLFSHRKHTKCWANLVPRSTCFSLHVTLQLH